MTNTNLLKKKIKCERLRQAEIANELGISPTSMSYKINGKSEFKVSEIDNICKVLKIKNKEPYFFA